MAQAQKVLKEAGKLNVIDTSGNNNQVQSQAVSRTLTADDSGKVWILGNAASGLTVTLPAVATAGSGWSGKFVVGTAPVAADYVVTENTGSDTNVLHGGIVTSSGNGEEGQSSTSGTGATQVNFDANVSLQGDFVDLVTDGTNWYVINSLAQANAAVTIS